MTSIPRSYHLAGVCDRLGLDRSVLSRAGILDTLKKHIEGDHAHYNYHDVENWRVRLLRRKALIRLGVLSEKAPLLETPAYDEYDFPCPECSGLAVWKPPQSKEEWSTWHALHEDESTHYPAACSQCDWKEQ